MFRTLGLVDDKQWHIFKPHFSIGIALYDSLIYTFLRKGRLGPNFFAKIRFIL